MRMLYKHPGKHKLHGNWFDYVIIEERDIDHYIADGWSLTTAEALEKNSSEPEKKEVPAAKRSFKNLTEKEISMIGGLDLPLSEIVEKHHVTYHAARRCRHELDKTTDNT